MMEAHCVRMWRRRKHRAEAMYALALLLARECQARAEAYGGERAWTFDALEVRRVLVRAGTEH